MRDAESEMEQKTLSSLVCKARGISPDLGNLTGICCVCGVISDTGYPVELPPTFQSWALFHESSGDSVICSSCKHMLTTRAYRTSSWLVTGGSFAFLMKLGVRRVLNHIPTPPWILYITRTYKKHGWISTQVNLSRECFVLTIDDERFLLTHHQLTDLTIKIRESVKYVGRWSWLQGTVVVDDEGKLALERPELYAWWLAHKYDSLVRSLVYVMVPTKKEKREQVEQHNEMEKKDPLPRIKLVSTLDSFLEGK